MSKRLGPEKKTGVGGREPPFWVLSEPPILIPPPVRSQGAQVAWQKGGERRSWSPAGFRALMSSLPPPPLCPRRGGGERNGNPMPLGRSLPVPRSALPTKATDHVSPPRRRPGMGTHVAPASSSSRGWVRTRRCAPGGRRAAPPAVPPPGPCLAHSQAQPLQRPGSGARGSSGNWLGGLKRNRASNSYSSYLQERNGERGDTRFPLPSSSRLFPWEAEKTALGGEAGG